MAILPSDEKETVSGDTGLRDAPVVRDVEPRFKAVLFRCPHPRCNTVASQFWTSLYKRQMEPRGSRWVNLETSIDDLAISTCQACNGKALWFEGRLLFPAKVVSHPTPSDMPKELQKDFEEARAVAPHSPRAAAALLRMCVENLCKKLTGKKKFDAAMAELERQGIPSKISMAMDVVRSNGNEVLHAGRLYGEDDDANVATLFGLVASIVNWAITEKNQLAELYLQIPQDKRKHIEERRAAAKGTGEPRSA